MIAIYLLALICTLNHIGYSASRVVVSLYALGLGANQFQIGVLMALYAFFPLLLAIHIGKLADRVGPRLPMLAGTAGVALVLPPLLPGFPTLYGTAILIGLGCGCGQPMSMSLIYALSPPGRAAESAGLRVMVNNIGSLAMPILLGGIGTAFGYFPVFLLNFVVLAAGGILFRRNVASQAGS